jgi:hypothetical protein
MILCHLRVLLHSEVGRPALGRKPGVGSVAAIGELRYDGGMRTSDENPQFWNGFATGAGCTALLALVWNNLGVFTTRGFLTTAAIVVVWSFIAAWRRGVAGSHTLAMRPEPHSWSASQKPDC